MCLSVSPPNHLSPSRRRFTPYVAVVGELPLLEVSSGGEGGGLGVVGWG